MIVKQLNYNTIELMTSCNVLPLPSKLTLQWSGYLIRPISVGGGIPNLALDQQKVEQLKLECQQPQASTLRKCINQPDIREGLCSYQQFLLCCQGNPQKLPKSENPNEIIFAAKFTSKHENKDTIYQITLSYLSIQVSCLPTIMAVQISLSFILCMMLLPVQGCPILPVITLLLPAAGSSSFQLFCAD